MKVTTKMRFDAKKLQKKINKMTAEQTAILSTQIHKDSNKFIKADSWALRDSSFTVETKYDKGVIKWVAPYARRQYYYPVAFKDKNTQASHMWFHKARAQHLKDWLELADKILKETI